MDNDSGGTVNASPPKRGRPSVKTAHIRLRIDVFQEWNIKKERMGYSSKTHSDFAQMLLHNCKEMQRYMASNQMAVSTIEGHTGMFAFSM